MRAILAALACAVLLFAGPALAETNVLSWQTPTGRCDTAAPLTNLAKIVIYRSPTRAALPVASIPGDPCADPPINYEPFAALKLVELPPTATTYTDTTAPPGVVYYVIVAVDTDGVASNPSPVGISSRPMPPISISIR